MKRIILASAIILFASGVANAGSAIGYGTPPAGFTWTGGYIGLQAGYVAGVSHLTFAPYKGFTHPNPSGFVGGIYVGYNFHFPNNMVLGADADVSYADGKGADIFQYSAGGPGTGERWKSAFDWTVAIRGRIGYALDRTLFYAAGGIAFTDLKTGVYDIGVLRGKTSESRTGWTIGAGIEHAFTRRLIGRVEYRFTDFGTKHYPLGWIPSTIGADVGLRTHDIRVGLAYKF